MAARRTRNAIADPEASLRPKTDYTDKGSTWDAANKPPSQKRRKHPDGMSGQTAAERRALSKLRTTGRLTPEERAIVDRIRSRD
jgi:hypothetical protein